MTKVFTAAAILRLAEDHELEITDKLSDHVSHATYGLLKSGGYDPDRITIQDLLVHTSGLYDYAEDAAFRQAVINHPEHRWTRPEEIAWAVNHGRPIGEPGELYGYSDTGYVVLGEVIEQTTGLPEAVAYRRLLSFDQLRLRSTWMETLEKSPTQVPRAHQYAGGVDGTSFDPSFDLYGGGGLVSTVDDLAKWYSALFHGKVFKSPSTIVLALAIPGEPVVNGSSKLYRPLIAYAKSLGPHSCFGHGGFWGARIYYCPDLDLTVSVTVNEAAGDQQKSLADFNTHLLNLVSSSRRKRGRRPFP